MTCSAAVVLGGCAPFAASPGRAPWQPCPAEVHLPSGQRLGVVGCVVTAGTGAHTGATAELDRRVSGELAAVLMECGRFRVVDRTALKDVLAEHALTLSGLVKDHDSARAPEISATDYLCLLRITGPRVTTTTAVDDPGMADTPLLARGTARCTVVLELVDSRSGEVVWIRSLDAQKSAFADSERLLDTQELLFRCAQEGVRGLVGGLRCAAF